MGVLEVDAGILLLRIAADQDRLDERGRAALRRDDQQLDDHSSKPSAGPLHTLQTFTIINASVIRQPETTKLFLDNSKFVLSPLGV